MFVQNFMAICPKVVEIFSLDQSWGTNRQTNTVINRATPPGWLKIVLTYCQCILSVSFQSNYSVWDAGGRSFVRIRCNISDSARILTRAGKHRRTTCQLPSGTETSLYCVLPLFHFFCPLLSTTSSPFSLYQSFCSPSAQALVKFVLNRGRVRARTMCRTLHLIPISTTRFSSRIWPIFFPLSLFSLQLSLSPPISSHT